MKKIGFFCLKKDIFLLQNVRVTERKDTIRAISVSPEFPARGNARCTEPGDYSAVSLAVRLNPG